MRTWILLAALFLAPLLVTSVLPLKTTRPGLVEETYFFADTNLNGAGPPSVMHRTVFLLALVLAALVLPALLSMSRPSGLGWQVLKAGFAMLTFTVLALPLFFFFVLEGESLISTGAALTRVTVAGKCVAVWIAANYIVPLFWIARTTKRRRKPLEFV
ncbi:MAG: hypothetical protein AAFX94_14250 [Myxococcota bacterium]